MKTVLAVIAGAVAIGVTAEAVDATSAKREAFYWNSATASLAISNSEWAARRGIEVADCKGFGSRKKQYGSWTFVRFACSLRTGDYERAGWVNLRTTGPETHKLYGFRGVPKPCRT